jgi:phage-related protein
MYKSGVTRKRKPVLFHGTSLDDLRGFPEAARREAGFQIDKLQAGGEPDDWKPMASIGSGAAEIRVRVARGAYRVIYVAKFAAAIHVLHAFEKKPPKTSPLDVDLARKRYRELPKEVAP